MSRDFVVLDDLQNRLVLQELQKELLNLLLAPLHVAWVILIDLEAPKMVMASLVKISQLVPALLGLLRLFELLQKFPHL